MVESLASERRARMTSSPFRRASRLPLAALSLALAYVGESGAQTSTETPSTEVAPAAPTANASEPPPEASLETVPEAAPETGSEGGSPPPEANAEAGPDAAPGSAPEATARAADGPVPRSWQRQTLLAATETEYLVLEIEGHNTGRPDVWTESVRVVRFDAASNARGAADLVQVEVWSANPDGTRRTDTSRASGANLGTILETFDGELVPPPAIRLRRKFHTDENGVFVLVGGERVTILTREEIETRAAREPHPVGYRNLEVTAMQQLGEQYFLTLRGGGFGVRRELVMRIPR